MKLLYIFFSCFFFTNKLLLHYVLFFYRIGNNQSLSLKWYPKKCSNFLFGTLSQNHVNFTSIYVNLPFLNYHPHKIHTLKLINLVVNLMGHIIHILEEYPWIYYCTPPSKNICQNLWYHKTSIQPIYFNWFLWFNALGYRGTQADLTSLNVLSFLEIAPSTED